MQPLISAAVFLLCFILENWGKLAAASNKIEFAPTEQRVSSLVDEDAIRTLVMEDIPRESDSFITFANNEEGSARSLQKSLNVTNYNTYFLFHDWKSHIYDKWLNDTCKAIRKHPYSIAFLWSWAGEAGLDYSDAAEAAQENVGKYAGRYLVDQYKRKQLDLNKVTLIGQGIGAHIIGIAGKTVYSMLGKKIFRIIGVSPAGPLFHFDIPSKRLYKDDAKCVATIHTDQLIYGYKETIGGLDFVVNGGHHQPGCKPGFDLCSHHRAIEYLIEGLNIVNSKYEAPNDDPEDGTWNFLRMVNGNCSLEHRPYGFTTVSQSPYLLASKKI